MSSKKGNKNKPKPTFWQTVRSSAKPVRQLLPYLKPYRGRFILGLILGAGFGIVSGLLPIVLKQVMTLVPGGAGLTGTKAPSSLVAPAIPDGGTAPVSVPVIAPATPRQPPAATVPPSESPSFFKRMFDKWTAKLQSISASHSLREGPGIESALTLCATIPLIMILRGALGYFSTYFMTWVSLRVLSDLRDHVFRHLMKQSLDFFHHHKSGELISRVYNDPRMAQMALSTISTDLVTQPIAIVVSIGVLVYLDWKFTLISLCLFPLCLLPVIYYGRKVRKGGGNEEDSAGGIMVILQESFAGIRVIKSLAREGHQVQQFETANQEQFAFSIGLRKSIEAVGPLVEGVSAIGAGLTIFYVWYSGISAATFIAMLTGLFMLYDPIKKLSRIHLTMQRTFASTSKIFDLLATKPTVEEKPGAQAITTCAGRLSFENVSFSYRKDRVAVGEVNFEFEAGKYYALVGLSGAGKSTILSLILRFYDPSQGIIRLDATDIRDLTLTSLREQIGIVTQDTFLFHDSIANNIRYGRMDATDEEIVNAARLAHADEFIAQLPKGYQTVIGDKGNTLSGGQQQRLAIARALLKNAPILLLDEATSALDSESELMIQSALELLASGRTVIAIAHRLSTILKADKIIVMDNGRIVEAGTHEELLAESTIYRRLYDIQFHHAGEPAGLAILD